MAGDDSMIQPLRILTSLELFLNAGFYCDHPCFASAASGHCEYSLANFLPLSVSFKAFDSGFTQESLVRHEAILNCADKQWSSFLCILGLSSILCRSIITYYPDFGEEKYKSLFNRCVQPRQVNKFTDPIHILFCHEGLVKAGEIFQPNHFVPILFCSHQPIKKKSTSTAEPSSASKKPKQLATVAKSNHPPKANILNFFHPTAKPLVNLNTPVKAPNETFSSSQQLTTLSSFSDNAAELQQTSDAVELPMTSSSFDVAFFQERAKGMTNSQISDLIKNVFKPDENFTFPKTADPQGRFRSFRYEWLKMYPWLCYSPAKDAGYCLSCVLFGDHFPGKARRIQTLYSQPLKLWATAASVLKRHAGIGSGKEMGLHACTYPILNSLISQMSRKTLPIETIIDTNLKKEIEENRKKLASIVDCVIFCGRLGIPLRGHRDDARYHSEIGCYAFGGVGNFVESLNFRVRAGDKILEEHLKTCGKNRTYISKTSQNKIINCCGQVITEQIIQDVKKAKFFSILADEAADSSHKEQLAFILRFVDANMNIREEFISFLHCKWGLSGTDLAKLILDALGELTLSIENCRGQGYDGAGAVAGYINGLAAQLLRLNKKALYTHCYSHRLNLSVCDSLAIVEVKNMLKLVNEVSHFIRISQTRSIPFEKNIKAHLPDSETRKSKLVDVCRTRWVERIEGLDTFQELFIPLFHTLDEMAVNVDGEYSPAVCSDATSHLTRIFKFDFIVALVITRHVLDTTLAVTQLLQGKSIDIMDGIHLIESLKKKAIMRNSVDHFHDAWYEEALQLAAKVGVEETKPRTVGKQTTRANTPFTTISNYFKRIITVPLIDHLNLSLKTRFDTDSINVYKGLCIVPEKMISCISQGVDWKAHFKPVACFYHDDLPNPLALDAELSLWCTYWTTFKGPRPSNISTTLKSVRFDGFENIKTILRILGTLPITSCECERSISALRMLKDYKRSTMVEDRLNGLALMKIHQEIVPDTNKVIDKFAIGNTRLKFM